MEINPFNLSFSTLEDTRLSDSARRLGKLLGQTPQYARFVECSQVVALDAQVASLVRQIRTRRSFYMGAEDGRDLQGELDALPAMQSFRQAESDLHALLDAVDQLLSRSAGVTFAANVPDPGCG